MHHFQSVRLSAPDFKSTSVVTAIVFAAATILVFLYSPFNKWIIFCYCLLSGLLVANIFLKKNLQQVALYFIMPVILWLSIAYPLYKKTHPGYAALKKIESRLERDNPSNNYYFLNNDTRSHFAFISKFDTAKQFLNLDTIQNGFKPFVAYQPKDALIHAGTFRNGWLIISDHYPENIDATKMQAINKVLQPLLPQIEVDNSRAYYLTSAETLKKLEEILNVSNGNAGCN